jgi:hypothetical protein
MEVSRVNTCYGQTIRPGTQVAYSDPVSLDMSERAVEIDGGYLRVAKVVRIIKVLDGWAEMDPHFDLELDDGTTVDCEKVAVTDGNFRYGTSASSTKNDRPGSQHGISEGYGGN